MTKLGKLRAILGMDFFQNHNCELKLFDAELVIGNQNVELKNHTNTTCARVKLCENRVILPQSDILIKGYIDGNCQSDFGMIEPDKNLQKRKSLLIAKSLNDITEKVIVISVLNLNDESVQLKKNLSVGTNDIVKVIDKQITPDSSENNANLEGLPSSDLTFENKEKLKQ